MIENKKILVLGLGSSGLAAIKLLYKNNEIIATDKKEDENVKKTLDNWHVKFYLSEDALDLIDESISLIIKSPGISPDHVGIKKAKELNIPITSEMEVAYHYLPNVKIIGITGSNGKTTTTTMLYDLLHLHNLPVLIGGNIGTPLYSLLEKIKDGDILVLEISDHQLYDLKDFKTDLSILTNLCETHLDYHGTYENYINVKKKIFNHHTSKDKAFINYQNMDSIKITKDILSTKIYFNNEENYYDDHGIYINKELVLSLDDIKIKGNHNYENILASLLVLKEFAWDKEIIKNYFQSFGGVEHRLEVVDCKKNILVLNDSKATNPTSTTIALKTVSKPTHLILGGMERKQDFKELNDYLENVKCIYAIGEVADRINEYAKGVNKPCFVCHTLENAMLKIKENIEDGEVILLSPASASWDQYAKFELRGEEFKKLVEKLFN